MSGPAGAGRHGTVLGGAMFTALNPGFVVWWATAGARLLLEGFRQGALAGAGLVLAGHWMADLGWYLAVSVLVSRGRQRLLQGWVDRVKDALAALLLLIALYFAASGLAP